MSHRMIGGLVCSMCLCGVLLSTSPPAHAQHDMASAATGTTLTDLQFQITNWTVPGTNPTPSGIFSSKRDDSTWYAAESANTIGRFDRKTKKFEEFNLRPGSHPNALVEHSGSGVQSTLYFTSRDGGYIGEFDPNTRDVREFRITGGNVHLQRLTFDRNGVVWFTVAKAQLPQFPQGAKVGFLNLFSSEIEFASIQSPGANPFDLAADSKGTIFFTELGSPRIGAVAPDSLKVTEFPLPNSKTGTHSLTITPDDAIWYTDSARGYLGRFEPKSHKFQEWPSPSGEKSKPGPIANASGIIWYVETGAEPNMLVRFDPVSQKFQTQPLSKGGAVGQLYAQPDGSLWLTRPQSNSISQVLPGASK